MSRLKEILDIVTANGEEAVDDLMQLMRPEEYNRDDMGQTFEDTIGYDPTSYYDKKDIKEQIREFQDEESVPDEVYEYLRSDTIEEDAYEKFDDVRMDHVRNVVVDTVLDETGYDLNEKTYPDEDVTLDDIDEEEEEDDE